MSSPCQNSLLAAATLVSLAGAAQARDLRACADPNNLPFSNDKGEGFENRIVELIARDLGAEVRYTWWAQRRGFVRNTVGAAQCDVVPGVAAGVDNLATTRPYYRSSYVFVTRTDRNLDLASLDDPRLKRLVIGVQMVGNDAFNTPPAHALAERGVTANVRGYMIYGDYARPNPEQAIVTAVADRQIDTALVWGPLAGYFARLSGVRMTLTPVTPQLDHGRWPMAFDIAMGVRKGNEALRQELDAELDRRHAEIQAILAQYGVPALSTPPP